MKHFIIVKFNNSVKIQDIVEPIKKLFSNALDINGVSKIEVYTSNSDKSNRHDIMIEMLLTKGALEVFDNSETHRHWKAEYDKYIMDKTIFDCE